MSARKHSALCSIQTLDWVMPPAVTGGRRGRRAAGPTYLQGPSPWLTVPSLVLFGLFDLAPLIGAICLSFMNWDGLGPVTFAGWSNCRRHRRDGGLDA